MSIRTTAAALLALLLPFAAPAQEAAPPEPSAPSGLSVELNNAEDTATGDCRLSFVAQNRMERGLAQVAWQVGVFDAQGIVRSLLVLDFGALPPGKTRITMFDLPGRGCADLSRIVVNDVARCQPDTGEAEPSLCMAGLALSSRTAIEFGI